MKEKVATLSLFVNLFLAIGKTLIGILINSASILAEGIHSGMDVFSSGISLIGIRISKKPLDKKHPYGYYKVEVLSGLIITITLFIAGIWMIWEAYKGFIDPKTISTSYLAITIMMFSVILNTITAKLKIYYGKKENSISLLSDGIHDKVDIYASLVVLIGITLMPYFSYIDSILASLIGLYIIKESFELGKEATDSLLDVSAGEEIENKIKEIMKNYGIELGEIKTQKKGSAVTANLEITLPKETTVNEATKISEKLKKELIESIESIEYVVIQIKAHKLTSMSFKPRGIESKISFTKGIRWQKRGKFEGKIDEAKGKGPEGYCICHNCGYKEKHKKGAPCSKTPCPKCGEMMTRK